MKTILLFPLLAVLLTCVYSLNVLKKKNVNPSDLRRLQEKENNLKLQEEKLKGYTPQKDNEDLLVWKNYFKEEIMRRAPVVEELHSNSNSTNETRFSSLLSVHEINPLDDPSAFFINAAYEKNINKIIKSGAGKEPWSGSYWPMKNVLLAVRYGKDEFNTIGVLNEIKDDYTRYYTYAESKAIYSQPDDYNKWLATQPMSFQEYANGRFSPAEKYDVLVGDASFSLTNWMRFKADQYEVDGDIPEWFGLCHGWAPASYIYKMPSKALTLVAADGRTRLTFFPDDIKALISLFFANADYTTRFVGRTCPYTDPKQIAADPATGLYIDEQCNSINPGAFVMILGTQMGANRKGFSMDPSPDGEIWNQPLKNYTLSYYHPISGNVLDTIVDTKISLESIRLSPDKFLQFVFKRASIDPLVKSLVGVYIEIAYARETEPIRSATPMANYYESELFVAVIFLDVNDNIIGGEWKYNYHPNFAWKPDENTPPMGKFDKDAPIFNGSSLSLRQLSSVAIQASKIGEPLKTVVEYLVNKSAAA